MIVAILVGAITVALALTIDIAALFVRRQELTTMAELGAAAGGLVVSSKIAEIAGERVQDPSPEEQRHPERYLTPEDRRFVQTDPALRNAVTAAAREYVMRNRPSSLSPFTDRDITITYPVRENSCTDPARRFVDAQTEIRYAYPFILGRIIAGAPTLPIRALSLFSIRLCP